MEEEKRINSLTALVAVERALYSFDRLYSYVIPHELIGIVEKGKRVLAPFGRGAKKITGLVMDIKQTEFEAGSLKTISEVLDSEVYLNTEMLSLVHWLKENTFCTYYDAVKCILPPVLRNPENAEKRLTGKTERIVKLSNDDLPNDLDLTPKQKSVISVLENNSASIKELCYICSVTPAVITNLIKKGILEEYRQPVAQTSDELIPERDVSDIELSDVQKQAFDGLHKLMNSPDPKCALLRGITGSGKTSVFIKLIGEALDKGKNAIVLVPEISLTPQTIAIFKGYFGDNAAVIHSGLSMTQRTDEYKRIRNGSARIVVGTRSAIFAPIDNIGIIVIDEEGEHTYKSERSPRYHARDIAKQRCFKHNSLLLLSSATPSMDSYRKSQIGKYSLFELTERYSGNALPDVHIIDMKIEAAMGNHSNFSEALAAEIRHNLQIGEQSLILLNRRGYYTYVCCIVCGEVSMCPNCMVPLTCHISGGTSAAGGMRTQASVCHYCGLIRSYLHSCPKCMSRFIKQSGTGTQRIEDELQELFPEARILRMDADTTMTKGAYERGFSAYGNREYDIMVGTQMIAKGLDFSNVTLVGVLLIDKSLYAGDYLGYERTFSLITQVVGRSGRGEKKGRAFLQTYTPEHYVLKLAARQDYRGFYEEEAAIRETMLFPPFCDLCVVETMSVSEKSAENAAHTFIDILAEQLKKEKTRLPIRVLGPVKSGVGNINSKFRYRIIVKCKNTAAFRKVMSDSLTAALSDKSDKGFGFCGVSVWFE
ncbi:MAG: primosomal protein N' [Oscillospiraceae bacterium]|nr:primosomal protein N' [Oscillospiraceae bacterium]